MRYTQIPSLMYWSPRKQQKYIFVSHSGKTYSTCQCISLEKCCFDEIRGCCCLFKFQMRKSNVFNGSWCAKLTWRVDNINPTKWNCLELFHHGDGIPFMSPWHRVQRIRYKQWYSFTMIHFVLMSYPILRIKLIIRCRIKYKFLHKELFNWNTRSRVNKCHKISLLPQNWHLIIYRGHYWDR